MYRFAALIVLMFVPVALAAPVPKSASPRELTPEHLVGTWTYVWGSWDNGSVTFHEDGSYAAIHVPGVDAVYCGTWHVEGNTLILKESLYTISAGEHKWGPTVYRLQFELGQSTLRGTANGSVTVKLSNRKR